MGMVTNVRLDMTTEQLEALAASIGKTGCATRKDITQFVEGAVAAAIEWLDAPEPEAPAEVQSAPVENDGYIGLVSPASTGMTPAHHVTNAMHSMGYAKQKLIGTKHENSARTLTSHLEALWRALA